MKIFIQIVSQGKWKKNWNWVKFSKFKFSLWFCFKVAKAMKKQQKTVTT
jgi:hypothetical protein